MQYRPSGTHCRNSSHSFRIATVMCGCWLQRYIQCISEGAMGVEREKMAVIQPKFLSISHSRCCGWFLRAFLNLKIILICSLGVNFVILCSMASLLPLKAPTDYFITGYLGGAQSALTARRDKRGALQQCHVQMPLYLGNTTEGTWDSVAQTVNWGVYKTMTGTSLRKVQKFVLLTGFHRRLDGVIGTLLNAHPHTVISPVPKLVLDLESKSYYTDAEKSAFYNYIGKFAFSRARNAMKRTSEVNVEWRYGHLPGMFSGVNEGHVNTYGVDMGETLTAVWLRDSRRVSLATSALQALVGVPIVIIHELHDPYDSIALIACDYMNTNKSLSNQEALLKAVGRYFSLAQSLMSFAKNCTNMKSRFVHGYQMETEPEKTLTKVCTNLGMFCSKTFVTQSASMVVRDASRPRESFLWSKDIQSKIQLKLEQFPFLKHYLAMNSTTLNTS